MTLDDLLASPDYQSAAPDDRMRRIDEWGVQSKLDAPDQADALDQEIPKLRAREYVQAQLPRLGIAPEAATRYRDMYLSTQKPSGDREHDPEAWRKYDEAYKTVRQKIAEEPEETRLNFRRFTQVMNQAGKHYKTAEEAKNGWRTSELDYGSGVKIPLETRTRHDRKEVVMTYPDGTKETFEYALDEEPPNAERLRTFMVNKRAEHLGEWKGYLSTPKNLGAHAVNAAMDIATGGVEQGVQTGARLAKLSGGGDPEEDVTQYLAANFVPLFAKQETGADGSARWVRRDKAEYLKDLPDKDYQLLADKALRIASGKEFGRDDVRAIASNPNLQALMPKTFGGSGETYFVPGGQNEEEALPGEVTKAAPWFAPTAEERRIAGIRIADKGLKEKQDIRAEARPFDVDPSNLLATQEDQLTTDGNWWGAQVADWLGDKAFNVPTVGQVAGSALPTMAAAVIGGPMAALPFATLTGLSEGNSAYEDTLQKNLDAGIDAETAKQRAFAAGTAYALVATALEQAGGVFEAKVFTGTIGKTRAGRAALGFAPETTEEAIQSAAQDILTNANVPEEMRKRASEILQSSVEAGAGALSFGVAPALGGLRKTPAAAAKQAVASAQAAGLPAATKALQGLEAQAAALSAAGQQAASKPAPPPKDAPAPLETPVTASVPSAAEVARAAWPLTYADEAGDAAFQNGAWLLPDGQPAPNAPALEAARQQYIATGDLPEGMQEAAAVETAPAEAPIPPPAPEAAAETPVAPEITAPPVAEAVPEAVPSSQPVSPEAKFTPPAKSEPAPTVAESAPDAPAKESRARIGKKKAPAQAAMSTREFRDHPDVANDVISKIKAGVGNFLTAPRVIVLKEKGKPRKLALAPEYKVGEWDWFLPFLDENPVALGILHDTIFRENEGESDPGAIDRAAAALGMRGDELGYEIADAAMKRARIAEQMVKGESGDMAMEGAEAQTVAFDKATKKGKGKRLMSTAGMEPGETFEVDGETVTVTDVDPETGDVTLRDGTRFGRQTLASGEEIWVEKQDKGTDDAQVMPFSIADQSEFDFDAEPDIEDVVAKLDASAKTPGITQDDLAAEIRSLAGNRVMELAEALGYKPSVREIASQLLAENRRTGAKRDEEESARTKRPVADVVSTDGVGERALTPEEKAERRKGETEDAPEGMRADDFDDEGAPNPNPVMMLFSLAEGAESDSMEANEGRGVRPSDGGDTSAVSNSPEVVARHFLERILPAATQAHGIEWSVGPAAEGPVFWTSAEGKLSLRVPKNLSSILGPLTTDERRAWLTGLHQDMGIMSALRKAWPQAGDFNQFVKDIADDLRANNANQGAVRELRDEAIEQGAISPEKAKALRKANSGPQNMEALRVASIGDHPFAPTIRKRLKELKETQQAANQTLLAALEIRTGKPVDSSALGRLHAWLNKGGQRMTDWVHFLLSQIYRLKDLETHKNPKLKDAIAGMALAAREGRLGKKWQTVVREMDAAAKNFRAGFDELKNLEDMQRREAMASRGATAAPITGQRSGYPVKAAEAPETLRRGLWDALKDLLMMGSIGNLPATEGQLDDMVDAPVGLVSRGEDVLRRRQADRTARELAQRGGMRFSVSEDQDAAYMRAVESGDMETAQRLVNEAAQKAGYTVGPMVHRTWSDFTEFKPGGPAQERRTWEKNGRTRNQTGPSGKVIFFSPTEEKAHGFHNQPKRGDGGRIIRAFLKIKNALYIDDDTREWAQAVFADDNKNFPSLVTDEALSEVEGAGHDGIIHNFKGYSHEAQPDEVIVFSPSQAKSAEPVTRDASGNVIPLSQRFNEQMGDIRYSTPSRKVIGRGATEGDGQKGVDRVIRRLPNAKNAWRGTLKQLQAHLRTDLDFQREWKADQKQLTGQTDAEVDAAYEAMVDGMRGKEGFTFRRRTYLILDEIRILEQDGNAVNAVIRVLIHEDAHEGLEYLREIDPEVEAAWQGFRDAVSEEELDKLAQKYTSMAGWRNNRKAHDNLANEWFAKRIEEVDRGAKTANGPLVARFMDWLKSIIQRLRGDQRNVTNEALVAFVNAARRARFRDSAEATVRGLRFSTSDPDGNIPANRVVMTQINDAEWEAAKIEKPKRPRYNLWSKTRRDAYKAYQGNPNLGEDGVMFIQFLGNPTANARIKQSLPIMVNFARATLGGVHGDQADVNDENTAKAWEVIRRLFSNKTAAARFQEEFQQRWSPLDSGGKPLHMGQAVGTIMQLEVMDYAVKLAGLRGDTSMMSFLYPYANDMILSDYQTMSGAARMLQARSAAVKESGAWGSLRLTYAGMREAAERDIGKDALEVLETAVDPEKNPELAADIETTVDAAVDNTANGQAVVDAVEAADEKAEEYESEGYWDRVLSMFEGEERADLYAFWQTLQNLDRKVQLIRELESRLGGSAGNMQSSLSEDADRIGKNPDDIRKALEKLKAGAEQDKTELMRLLGKLTKDDASSESKDKRRKILRDPSVKAAVKALSENKQAAAMIKRFENRNKRLKRDKPAWRKVFEEQVRTPKPEDAFKAEVQAAGIGEAMSHSLYLLANQLHGERSAKRAAKAAAKGTPAPKTPSKTPQQDAEDLAKKIAKGLTPKTAKGPVVVPPVQAIQRQYLNGEIDRATFDAELAKLGVDAATIQKLGDLTEDAKVHAYEQGITGDYTQPKAERRRDLEKQLKDEDITQAEFDAAVAAEGLEPKPPRRNDVKAFIASIARKIAASPIQQQQDPVWRRNAIIDAFKERGMNQAEAELNADKLGPIIDKAIREGQAKAAIKAAKGLKSPGKLNAKELAEAIRTGAIDPLNPNPVVKILAEKAGYKALTPAQFQRLAQLDQLIVNQGPTVSAKAYAEMRRILGAVSPRKTGWAIATQTWINSALSSLSVMWLNWAHPIYIMLRRTAFDLASLVADVAMRKTRATDAPLIIAHGMGNWLAAMKGFSAEAKFALKNDAYRNRVLEVLSGAHRMHEDMVDAAQKIKTGTPTEKVKNLVKFAATTTDFMRRILASADQSWGGVIQQYVVSNEAMRMLVQQGGMTVQGAAMMLNSAHKAGEAAMARYINDTFTPGVEPTWFEKAEAVLVGKDAMQDELADAVNSRVARAPNETRAGDELLETGRQEASMELGNRLPESGARFDVVNGLLEMFKAAASAIRRSPKLKEGEAGSQSRELFGRMLTGFITVGANILNRSAYFTPLGIYRALYKMDKLHRVFGDPAKINETYTETMATEGQERMRLVEGIVGTAMMMVLYALRQDSDDEEGFVITGEGPENRTVRDAWQKMGHKPAHLEWVGSDGRVTASVPYSRGGLDHLALPITFIGALDDVQLDGSKAEKKNASFAWSYTGTLLKNLANQARFFGMKNLVSTVPTSLKDSSLAGNVAYMSAPFIPWSGLLKSTGRLFTGQQDQSSWDQAVLAQLPITPLFTGRPQLNSLGDQVGANGAVSRLEFSGMPIYVGVDPDSPNASVYKLMLEKGIGPAVPMRSSLEADNGFLSDDRWTRYVKVRGRFLKEAIRDQRAKLQFMPTAEAKDAMSDISRDATRAAKKEMSLK